MQHSGAARPGQDAGRRIALGTGLALSLLSAASCTDPQPVAELEVTPASIRVPHGISVPLRLIFEQELPLDRLHGEPIVFVHLLKRPGEVLRTFDHEFPTEWRPGSVHSYEIDLSQSALASPLAPGRYPVTIGLADSSWGYRWPLRGGQHEMAAREYLVGTLEVPGWETPAPSFSFSRALQASPDPDHGPRGDRFVTGPATIVVRGIEEEGDIRLGFEVEGNPKEGGPESTVRVTADCARALDESRGPGRSSVDVRVPPDALGRCTIRLTPELSGGAVRLIEASFRPLRRP